MPATSAGQTPANAPEAIRTRCSHCKSQRTFHIEWIDAPLDHPSETVDLAQWMGLYYLYADRMDKAQTPKAARDAATRAADCLAEALKFYGPDEMPPESAFRAEASAAAFENNPATFARTHLRELQAVLPVQATSGADGPGANEEDLSHDKNNGRKAWWKLWRKQ